MDALRLAPTRPQPQLGAIRRGGRRQRWLHWTHSLIKRLPIALANRWPKYVNLRIFASDQLQPARIENLRQLAFALAPRGIPVKLYILPRPGSRLLNLTCSLRSKGCEMVTLDPVLLDGAAGRGELAGQLNALFAKCLAQASIR